MIFEYILGFICLSFLFGVSWKNISIGTIDEIRTHSRYYPKAYMVTPRWVKKKFNVKQQLIPKYLYYFLISSRFFVISLPINSIVTVIVNGDEAVVGLLILIQLSLSLFNTVLYLIITPIFKR